jgi:V8-like Glu-specific endopeptidase
MKNIIQLVLFAAMLSGSAEAGISGFHNWVRPNVDPIGSKSDVDWEGILAIGNPAVGGCSAALVRYEKSRPQDRAMVLTNGHCFEEGFIPPNTFLLNKDSRRTFLVLDPKSPSPYKGLGRVTAEKVIYATMTKTDITLYRLTETFEEIEKRLGVRALTLSSAPTKAGGSIEIASGFWAIGYACDVDAISPGHRESVEADVYEWKNALRYSEPGCDTKGGTSGSPIVQAGSRTIIGINNTGNESGEKCTENNPCELDRDGNVVRYEKGLSYVEQIHYIYSCLDSNLNFDVTLDTCNLPGGKRTDGFKRIRDLVPHSARHTR